jgi:glycosyltransferase involved in cell wall biosynthesis
VTRPLRVLFVNEGDSAGTRGQGRFELLMREHAEAAGVEASFATLRPLSGWRLRAASGLSGRLWRRDLDLQTARWHSIQAQRVRAMLRRLLAAERPDVIHVHPHTAAFALESVSTPCVLSVDAEIWDWRSMAIWQALRPWSRLAVASSLRAERRALESAAHVVAWTEWARAGLKREAPQARIAVEHPGLDLSAFTPAPPPPGDRPVRFLFVGARFERKGGLDLIEALKPQLAAGRACLDVVSPDNLSAHPGIAVHRLDKDAPRLRELFQRCDVFCLPSYGDAAPWVVLEAMACGRPVIGSRTGAIPEFLDAGRAGVIVGAGDVRALREAAEGLIAEPSLRLRLGEAARRRCELHYDARANTGRLVELLAHVGARSG